MEFKNQYLTYGEYSKLGGKISEAPFNLLEYKAEKKVDEMSSNRFRKLEEFPQELKLCINELIDVFNSEDNSGVLSESVGNYSITKQSKKESDKAKESIIKQYLSETAIDGVYALYCGADDYKHRDYFIS